jgi:hypothetical protein
MPSEGFGGNGSEGTSGATAAARSGDGGNGGNGGNFNSDQSARDAINAADAQAAASAPVSAGDTSATGVRDTDSGLSAVSPFAAFTSGFQTTPANERALRDQETVRSFLAQVAKDKETSKLKPGESYNVNSPNVGTSVTNALDAARASGLTSQTIHMSGGKNNPEGRDVTTQGTNIPIASFLGYTGDPGNSGISYAEAQMLKTLGAGDLTGVNLKNMPGTGLTVMGGDGMPIPGLTYNEPGQDANSIVSATDAAEFVGKLWDVAKNFLPGYGAATFIANLISGKMTIGQAATSLLGNRAATLLGVSPSLFNAALSGQYGNGVAGYANGVLNSLVAKETKMDPRVTGLLMSKTGLSDLTRNAAAPLNVGPNFAGALAGTIDSGLSSFRVGKGPAETSANVPNIGMDTQSQVENILNPNRISPTTAPLSLEPSSAPSTPLSSAGTSSGSYAGALSNMPTLGTTSGLYRIGNTNYTPYSQDLAQLNLPSDEFTKQSDIGNIPTYNMDIAKMVNAPFAAPFDPFTQFAAAGGSIRHFAGAGAVYEDDPAGVASRSDPGMDELAKKAALQLQYYNKLEDEKQNADIMSALKSLSNESTAEARPQSSPLFRLGQTGVYTPPKVLPQLAALLQARGMRLAEGGQPDDHKHPNYDGTPVFRTGGLSGLGGKYVEGKGDGTSDDITAMLADGEYVFSADVVSALGNGSNKAGAQVLDKTVQAIRSRARSTAPDKLPPDAKSPLEYMQSVKGKKYG